MAAKEDTSYLESKKELCDLYKVDFEKVKDLHSQIAPLIRKIAQKTRIVNKLDDVYKDVNRNLRYWREIWSLSRSKVNPQQKSLLELFLYLTLSEGIFDALIQVIAFLLIENHHDLYDPDSRTFLTNYEGLEKIRASIKQKFIELHGFRFVSDAFDRDLRNCIAHFDFVVRADGSIVNRRTGKEITDLEEKANYLGTIGSLIPVIINKVLSEDPEIELDYKKKKANH